MSPLFGGRIEEPGGDGAALAGSEIGRVSGLALPQLTLLRHLAGEAVQALEHAALIRVSWQGGGQHCVATRLGRSAVERGTAGLILSGGAGG